MNTPTRWSAIVISLFSGFAVFANAMAAESIPVNRTITQIRSFTTYAQIDFVAPRPNSLGCSSAKANRRVAIDWKTQPDRKVMFATALLAFATNKLVGFAINRCHGSGVPLVVRISVAD